MFAHAHPNTSELLLEDGRRFSGLRFGAPATAGGEVVFATGMTGYVESLTDPSYRGQILVLSYPLQGNYGVAPAGHPSHQSASIQARALVVPRATPAPSHWQSARTLDAWLSADNVPGLEGVDTRGLIQHLRSHGTMRGWILAAGLRGEALEAARRDAAGLDPTRLAHTACLRTPLFLEGGERTVLLVDAGCKEAIVRELVSRRLSVLRVPFDGDLPSYLHQRRIDGIVLSNGPGDPADLRDYVAVARALLEARRPVFGICLGSQILALAAGARTYKLKFGHRSQNQPVKDLRTGHSYVTSQNHGYAVDDATLPRPWSPWFVNLNDATSEGLRHELLPFCGVQFHPEGSPGPRDTRWLFDEFVREMDREAKVRGSRAWAASGAP